MSLTIPPPHSTFRFTCNTAAAKALAGFVVALPLSLLFRLAAADEVPPPRGPVLLNEILAANRSGILDEEGRSSDWIELSNTSDRDVDLSGWQLSDDSTAPGKWTFPRVSIAAKGYLLVWASGKGRHLLSPKALRHGAAIPFETAFIRAGERWRYVIADPQREGPPKGWAEPAFDDSAFAAGPSGFGYGDNDDATVVPEGTNAVFIRREFTVEGDPTRIGQLILKIDFDDGFVAYLNGERVAAANAPVDDPTFATIATSKHEPGRAECFDLTPHLSRLKAGRNVLAIAGLNNLPSTDMSLIPELGTFPVMCQASFELKAEGGEVLLRNAGGQIADRVAYPSQVEDRSYGRSPDGTGAWAYFLTPSPRAPNRYHPFGALPDARIAFQPQPGFYKEPLSVTVAVESKVPGVELRYSMDGSPPSATSELLSGPLSVSRNRAVRAAAFVGEERATPVLSGSYFFRSSAKLPVLSITMAPREFVQVHTSINARGRPSERPAHIEIFQPDGTRVAATDVGFRLHGGYGRNGGLETKKSYKLYFRRSYGDACLTHPLIPGLPKGPVDNLVLRASFNDRLGAYHAGATFLRDQVLRDLHRDMGSPSPQGSWCLLYLNMRSLGLYNAVERIDENFLRRHFGPGDWDLIKTGGEVVCGERQGWDELVKVFAKADLSQNESYEVAKQRIDLQSFTSYMILNLWSQNEDWPQNNWYVARHRRKEGESMDGRWVFIEWDAEWGMGLTPDGWQADSIRVLLGKRAPLRDLFAALIKNGEYRAYFRSEVDRYLEGALSPENVRRHVDREAEAVRPVIPSELRTNAAGFTPEIWEANVETLRRFADNRGKVFRRLVARALEE